MSFVPLMIPLKYCWISEPCTWFSAVLPLLARRLPTSLGHKHCGLLITVAVPPSKLIKSAVTMVVSKFMGRVWAVANRVVRNRMNSGSIFLVLLFRRTTGLPTTYDHPKVP